MADLREDLHTEHIYLNMGPSHPAMHGTIRIFLELDGETVINSDVEIGYLHRGFEKMCENRTYTQGIIYTDRLNYVSPLINNIGYALAVEKLLGVEVPPRCAYIRVIASEISRICDHLTCIAAFSMELGALTVFLYLMKAREYIYELIEELTGARVTTNYARIGGVAYDLPDNFAQKVEAAHQKVREILKEVDGLLTKNRIFIDRMVNVGVISKEDALSFGWTGPCLRSTGINYDVRKFSPYLVYDKLEFEVPVGKNGDNYDRYLVRMKEMEQSMRIIEQALAQIPEGDIWVPELKIAFPPKEDVLSKVESLITHFKLVMPGHGITPPAGEVYFAVEGANGELGFYIVSDGTDKPYKCRVRPPCFYLMSGLSKIIQGAMVPDIIPTFGTINMIGGECDR